MPTVGGRIFGAGGGGGDGGGGGGGGGGGALLLPTPPVACRQARPADAAPARLATAARR